MEKRLLILMISIFVLGPESLAKLDSKIPESAGLEAMLSQTSKPFVVLNIWSPFCESCGGEVAELNRVSQIMSEKVTVIGISVRSRSSEIKAFIEHFKPVYMQWAPDKEFSKNSEKLSAVPMTYLLNNDRKVVRVWLGKVLITDIAREMNVN